jgi:phosphoglycolate phosphatase-like HAD superfamily hydrolase
MRSTAIAFDFDGTLIRGGWDKGVHILYASTVACTEHGYADYLNPANLDRALPLMVSAYMNYMGSPRFQQLSALVNALVNGVPFSVNEPAELKVDAAHLAAYEAVKNRYNEMYSALNDTAARLFWRPFPRVKPTLAALAKEHDLYIASGVLQDILDGDLARHGFDLSLFQGICGSNRTGGADKGQLLVRIREKGYKTVLFCGDSSKDCDYANAAKVRFFRVSGDASYGELLDLLKRGEWPDQPVPWSEGAELAGYYRAKALKPIRAFMDGTPMSLEAISTWINS